MTQTKRRQYLARFLPCGQLAQPGWSPQAPEVLSISGCSSNKRSRWLALLVIVSGLLGAGYAKAGGTWTALTTAPPVGLNNCLLLSDGTVLGMNGAGQCARLTPDIYGSYINGTWTTLTTMNSSRLFFSSDVLTNGNVFVAGGEYGDANHYDAELYDSLGNTWTIVPGSQSPNFNYSDSPSEMLPNGNVLESDSQSTYQLYNVASNLMVHGGSCGDMNEVCWIKLANGSIFGVDDYGNSAEHFVSSSGQWVQDAASTPSGFQDGDDTDYLLPNGQVFHVGSTTNTGFYTPGGTAASAGTLVNGPNLPMVGTNQLVGGESPGAMLPDGNILLDLAPNGGGASGGSPCYFYEYNYLSNTFTPVSAPGGGSSYGNSPFVNSMLVLPDGSVLLVGGQNSASLYVYTPVGTPLTAGQPVIDSITQNLDGSYHLTGTGLNGISEGAMFGDDEQMACNYPLVRLTNNATGHVYYARTHNWSSTTVQNTNVVSTEFSVPAGLPTGTYSLAVTAVGNPSAPASFTNTPPPAPTGLAGTAGNAQTILSWNPVSGAKAYNVRRLTTIGTPYYATVATVTGTSCTNVGLVNAFTYSYVVTAVAAQGESAYSAALTLTPSGPPPVPANVTATPDTFARIDLAWSASYGAANYVIERSLTSGGPYAMLATPVNPFYTDTGLVSGKEYYYVVSAVSAEGESSNSMEVSATAQAVANFGFEIPVIGSGNYVYNLFGGLWTFSGTNGNGSGIVANGSGFSNPNAPEGVQAAFVQSNGVISQVLSGFVPGTTYEIIYAAAQRPDNGMVNIGGESWSVMIDNTVIQTNSPGGASYTIYTATFTATAVTHTLSFVGTDLAGGDNTVFLDDVQVTIAPPPVIPNFSFELPSLGAGNYRYNPSGGSWAFNGASPNGSGIVANGSAFGNPNAPLGSQAAFVQEYGTISQTLSGFTPGNTYTLAYSAAQRGGSRQTWNVKIDGTTIQSNSPGSTSYTDYMATFVATATSHTLTFVGTDLAGGDNTVFLDCVSLTSPLQPVAPVVMLTAPTNSASFIGVPVINLMATVATNGNLVSGVQFYYDTTNVIGQDSSPPYSDNWTNPNTGSYSVFARATYNGGSVADSPAAVITVINTNVNFGFETPSIASGNFEYDPAGASWTFDGASGNGSGLIANGSGFGNPNAPQGVQAAFVQSYGSISQMLYGFTPGTAYTITYSAAQRSGASQHGGESWNVLMDDTVIATNNPGGTSYTTYTASFIASAFAHTLSFVGTDLVGGDNTVFLDNVRIDPPISEVPPTVVLTSPADNSVFSAANPVNLAATVAPNGNTIVGVQFYSDASNVITQVTAPYTYAWSSANAGISTVFARLVFNGSNTVDSATVSIMVTNPPPIASGIGLGADGQTVSVSGLGLASRPYYLDTASNLIPPVVWMPIQTNLSDASGNILFTNVATTSSQQFFLISAPW
jgi:hypothetical protein